MDYRWRSARADIAHVVDGFWVQWGAAPTRVERIFPMTRPHVVVNLAEADYSTAGPGDDAWRQLGDVFLTGMRTHPVLSRNPDPIANAGVVVRPEAQGLLGLPARAAARQGPQTLPDWRRPDSAENEGVLDALEQHVRSLVSASSYGTGRDTGFSIAAFVVAELQRRPRASVAELADDYGLSPRALSAAFEDAVGITPKLYSEVAQFERMLDLLNVPDDVAWSELAVRAGYFDQSHAIRQFKRFTGWTPAAYYERVRQLGPDALRFVPDEAGLEELLPRP